MAVKGGHKFAAMLKRARSGSGVTGISVGFFRSARYPDGTQVAAVAAWNEFGTSRGIPERPFFRQALKKVERDVKELLRERMDPQRMVVTDRVADEAGALVAGAIQKRIRDLRDPPNAPATILRKGSSNPLIDTSTMMTAVTWKVKR